MPEADYKKIVDYFKLLMVCSLETSIQMTGCICSLEDWQTKFPNLSITLSQNNTYLISRDNYIIRWKGVCFLKI